MDFKFVNLRQTIIINFNDSSDVLNYYDRLTTVYPLNIKKTISARQSDNKNIAVDINKLLESGLFRISTAADDSLSVGGVNQSQISDLKLLGTVTGPSSIARAMVIKKGEKQAEIFKLGKDVYGYTLSGIESTRIYLSRDKNRFILELYEKKEIQPSNSSKPVIEGDGLAKKSISRAEFQQKMLNDIDNALQGVKAGPHRVNGQIEGFQLIRIRPYNVLYEYGLRSGDIIKRINGKKIDSTEKLYNMWQGFKNESKLSFDIERDGKIITIDVNITD